MERRPVSFLEINFDSGATCFGEGTSADVLSRPLPSPCLRLLVSDSPAGRALVEVRPGSDRIGDIMVESEPHSLLQGDWWAAVLRLHAEIGRVLLRNLTPNLTCLDGTYNHSLWLVYVSATDPPQFRAIGEAEAKNLFAPSAISGALVVALSGSKEQLISMSGAILEFMQLQGMASEVP